MHVDQLSGKQEESWTLYMEAAAAWAKDKHLISTEPLHAALGSTRAAVKLVWDNW